MLSLGPDLKTEFFGLGLGLNTCGLGLVTFSLELCGLVNICSFVLCGATMEAGAGMLIHSTALRPITTRPSAHPHCVWQCL